MTPCPTCGADAGAPLFAFAAFNGPDSAFWCPRCKGEFRRDDGTPVAPPVATVPDIHRGDIHGLPYEMRLEPDGLALFRMHLGRGRCVEWRATPAQLRRLGHAALHIANAGEERQEHLRGADRWVFRRGDGDVFFVRIHDSEAELVPWHCAGRKQHPSGYVHTPEKCARCEIALVKGDRGYKAGKWPWSGRVSWSGYRFCATCVEAAPKAEKRGPLRVVGGGAG